MFPLAYYREQFDGPIEGKTLEVEGLFLERQEISTGGIIAFENKTYIDVDTSAGPISIDGFTNIRENQVVIIIKSRSDNSLTIRHDHLGDQKIKTVNGQDIVFGAGTMGGAQFMATIVAGETYLVQMDSNGVIPVGLEAAPSISFAGDLNTGIYQPSADSIGFSTNGTKKTVIGANSISHYIPNLFSDGSAAVPSIAFEQDADTGFYRMATDAVGVSIGGVHSHRFRADRVAEFNELAVTNGGVKSDNHFLFLTEGGLAQGARVGHLTVSSTYSDFSLTPSQGIYARGNVRTGGQFQGTATSAMYADVAERYEADKEYLPGTIVSLGGEKEITESKTKYDSDIIGVISTNPAFKMNEGAGSDETHPYVALLGRVPCKVIGSVKKGDRIISSDLEGVGIAISKDEIALIPQSAIVGRALKDKTDPGVGLVEILVGRR